MEKALCTICLFLLLGTEGCAICWYQPGTSLEQCTRDLTQCNYEAARGSYTPHGFGRSAISAGMQEGFQRAELCKMCMRAKGYYNLLKEQLPAEIRTRHVDGILWAAGR